MSTFPVIFVMDGVISMEMIMFVLKVWETSVAPQNTYRSFSQLDSEHMCDFHVKTETSQSVISLWHINRNKYLSVFHGIASH
jgi:hypothetical protein